MRDKCHHVVICSDARFALGCWIALWSCHRGLAERAKDVVYHVVTAEREARWMSRINGLAVKNGIRVEFVRVSSGQFDGLPQTRNLPKEAYLRLLAPGALEHIDSFVYLDADVLVRSSIWPLFEVPEEPFVIAGSLDYYHQSCAQGLRDVSINISESLGLSGGAAYVNSGVLAIQAQRWRQHDVSAKCMDWLIRHRKHVRHGDQDGINAVLAGKCQVLDPSWNVQVGALDFFDRCGWPESHCELKRRRDDLLCDGRIVHFIGPSKPWKDGLRMAYAGEYRRAVISSGWVPRHQASLWHISVMVRGIMAILRRRWESRRGGG